MRAPTRSIGTWRQSPRIVLTRRSIAIVAGSLTGDRSRTNQEHMQALRTELQSELLRIGRDGKLGGRVRTDVARRRLAGQRTDVDHMAVTRQQVWKGRLRATHQGHDVQIEQLAKVVRRSVGNRATHG